MSRSARAFSICAGQNRGGLLRYGNGFKEAKVSPRMVYVDSSRPELVEGFTRNTFTAMIEGVKESALQAGLASQVIFDKGVSDLYRTAEADGVFCYTFFKAKAYKD